MPNAIRRLLSCSFSSSSPPPVSDAIASLFSLEWGKLRDSRESIWSDDLFFKSFQGPSVSSFICYLSFVFNKLEKRTPWIRVASSIRDVFVDIKESRSFLSFFLTWERFTITWNNTVFHRFSARPLISIVSTGVGKSDWEFVRAFRGVCRGNKTLNIPLFHQQRPD